MPKCIDHDLIAQKSSTNYIGLPLQKKFWTNVPTKAETKPTPLLTGDEHTREHQQVADLPELNENKEKGLGNLKLPALIVARFTNACTYSLHDGCL